MAFWQILQIPVMRRISTLFANYGHAEDLHSTYPLLADFANPGHAEDLHSTYPLLADFANLGHAEDLHTFYQTWSCGGSPHFLPIPVMRRISTVLAPFWQTLPIPVMRRISTLFCQSRSCGGFLHFEIFDTLC